MDLGRILWPIAVIFWGRDIKYQVAYTQACVLITCARSPARTQPVPGGKRRAVCKCNTMADTQSNGTGRTRVVWGYKGIGALWGYGGTGSGDDGGTEVPKQFNLKNYIS